MLKRIVLYILSALVGVSSAVVCTAAFTVTKVTGNGMEPVIERGSTVLVNKLAYGFSHNKNPNVGDIVAFESDVYGEEGEGRILVKRVAATTGDTVEIKDNIFYLNGRPYEKHMAEAADMAPVKRIKLKEDQIFVLSDNRKSSMDSRNEAIGVIDSRECIGKICLP